MKTAIVRCRSKPDERLLQVENADDFIGASPIAEFTCGSFTGYVYRRFHIAALLKIARAGNFHFSPELSGGG